MNESNNPIPQKNFNVSDDKRDISTPRFNHKLQIALDINGFRELSLFASKIGFSRSFVSKVLHGRIKPTLSQAQIISQALNVQLQTIFDLSDIRNFLRSEEKGGLQSKI